MTGQDYLVAASRDAVKLAAVVTAMHARPGWQRQAFEGPAAIFTRSRCPYAVAPGAGDAALVGAVFHRQGPSGRRGELDDATWTDLRHGSVDSLLKQHWGGFVALSSAGGSLQVMRDPSAAMPCYYARIPGGILIGSSVSALMQAGLPKPSVALDHLAQGLYRADLPSQATALTGVKELLPGTTLGIGDDALAVRQVWSPWDYAAIDGTLGFGEHAERLRRAVQNGVAAWSSTFGPIMIGVSGGLDSSILAACMVRHEHRPICVTLATDDPEGDERVHARALCGHLGMTLIEAEYDLADIQIECPARPDLPRPTGRLIAQAYNAAVSRAARDHGIDAFFTGNGGDNVFAFSQSAGAIADRLLYEGVSMGTWETARNICRLTGCSLGQAVRSALRVLGRPRRYRWRPDRRFLAKPVVAERDREPLAHPWLDAPRHALPGKAAHIASLLRIQRHLDGTGQLGGITVINPLMSQPVIEACLAIPSWMWCRDGRNRAVAREAFRSQLPQTIVERISKGGPDGFSVRIVGHFRDRIRERLLDGDLARDGIIDRAALERRLSDDRPDWSSDRVRLLELLEAQAWVDHWRAP